MSREANKVLTQAATETWNRMMKVIEELLRPKNRNYVLGAFKAQQSMVAHNGSPAIYMTVGGLSGGLTDDQALRIKEAAGAPCQWRMSVHPGANTGTLELWITVITPDSTVSMPPMVPGARDLRSPLRRSLEDQYTTTYWIAWLIRLLVLYAVAYFFLEASPATRAIIFG